jgi:hypothetical protein
VFNLIQTALDRGYKLLAAKSDFKAGLTGCSHHRTEAGRVKGSVMHTPFNDSEFRSTRITDECPTCREQIALSLVEPHLLHEGWEIYTYTCKRCGPIKSRIVPSPSNRGSKPLAA